MEESEKKILIKQNHPAAMRRRWPIVLLVICLIAFGMWAIFHKSGKAARKEANTPVFGVPVVAVAAKKGDFPVYLTGLGTITPVNTVTVRAAYDATVASYRQTVLTGFQEVEDNLAALRIFEDEARAQEEAVKASRESVTVTMNGYKEGTLSYLNVIVAQAAALNNERTAVDILTRQMTANVLLVKALGGGWGQAKEDQVPK
jgi:hypothetical protein